MLLFQLSVHQFLWQRGGEITKATQSVLVLCPAPTRSYQEVFAATYNILSKTTLYQGRNCRVLLQAKGGFTCTCAQLQLSSTAERISQLTEN